MSSSNPPSRPPSPADELDGRRAAILDAVVAEYIATAQPVGSATVARAATVGVSPATVRAEMVALEREGFLTQPHTSAGRVPTDRGYRFFVDHLGEPGILGPVQRTEVSAFFDALHGEMDEVLERTSGMLAALTSHAAVVVGPAHDTSRILTAQLVALAPRVVLAVVVLDDGAVEKSTIELDDDVTEATLRAAEAVVRSRLEGQALNDVRAAELLHPDRGVVRLATRVLDAVASFAARREPEEVFIGGSSRLAASFDAVETVSDVLAILEQQLVVVELLNNVLGKGLSVAIGEEHGFEPLSSCAVVVAPLSIDGTQGGVVAILGPTRMHYPSAIAAAGAVSTELGHKLETVRHGEDHTEGTRG
jgi:heat-inducible transcriptional repressor